MKKLIIGITGGIGSGKSTVANFYKSLGYPVLKADDIAKKIMVDDNKIVSSIKKQFGVNSYSGYKLNRKYLAKKVFGHPENLAKLNKIVHPKTIAEIKKEAENYLKKNDMVFVEAAILFEANWEYLFDYIILIVSDENTRIKRIIDRDNTNVNDVKSRIMHQLPDNIKQSKADFIIVNDTSLKELKEKSRFIVSVIKKISH